MPGKTAKNNPAVLQVAPQINKTLPPESNIKQTILSILTQAIWHSLNRKNWQYKTGITGINRTEVANKGGGLAPE